jgi:hypothetical protein
MTAAADLPHHGAAALDQRHACREIKHASGQQRVVFAEAVAGNEIRRGSTIFKTCAIRERIDDE